MRSTSHLAPVVVSGAAGTAFLVEFLAGFEGRNPRIPSQVTQIPTLWVLSFPICTLTWVLISTDTGNLLFLPRSTLSGEHRHRVRVKAPSWVTHHRALNHRQPRKLSRRRRTEAIKYQPRNTQITVNPKQVSERNHRREFQGYSNRKHSAQKELFDPQKTFSPEAPKRVN